MIYIRKILKDFWKLFKPQNSNEIALRIVGVLNLIMSIMILKHYIELDTVGQFIYTFIVGYLGIIGTSNRKEE